MLRAAFLFFVLALTAFLLGATGIAGISMEVGRMLLSVFIILSVVSVIASLFFGRHTNHLQ